MSGFRFFSFCCVILVCAIVAIPQVPSIFPQFSYGLPSERTFSATVSKASYPTPARLLSSHDTPNTIVFTGDVLMARNVEFLMRKYSSNYPFENIDFTEITTRPYVVGNFEASVPEQHEMTISGSLRFSVDQKYLSILREKGFSHLSLANNHSLDFGPSALKNTKSALKQADIVPVGNPQELSYGSVAFLAVHERTVGIIAVQTLTDVPSSAELEPLFDHANKKSDFQIVYIHWGTEYEEHNDRAQALMAQRLVNAGADLIIGHHPHVVQNIELVDGVPVLYSLGNYIFDQYFSTAVEEGLLASVEFGEYPLIRLVPVESKTKISQPAYMKTSESRTFLRDLADRSDPALKSYIERGFVPLYIPVATSSKIAMMNG